MRYKVVVGLLTEKNGFGNLHFLTEVDNLFDAMEISKLCAKHLRDNYIETGELDDDLKALRGDAE
jgi:hypothetical protein